MRTLGARLRELRKAADLTQKQLASRISVNRATLANWETGRATPDAEMLRRLANYFSVSVDDLLGHSPVPDTFPFRPIPTGPMVQVPVVGTIRAGEPILAAQNIEGYCPVAADEVAGGEHFFLRVKGDSMVGARIQEGDLVLVRRQADVDDGDIAVVMVNDEEATIKRVYREGGRWLLKAENPNLRPLVVDKRDVRIIGRVIQLRVQLG
ncbi:MAG: transcriptional repressor LexA [Bacillota bacterium]|nr:transcriptional repressor LexA [Bacillota bacterium]